MVALPVEAEVTTREHLTQNVPQSHIPTLDALTPSTVLMAQLTVCEWLRDVAAIRDMLDALGIGAR